MQNGLVEKNYSWKSANSTTKLSSLEPEDALQSLLFDTLSIQQQCRGLVLQGSTEYITCKDTFFDLIQTITKRVPGTTMP